MSIQLTLTEDKRSGTLDLFGEVGLSWWEDESLTATDVNRALIRAQGVPLHVRVFSYGGDAFEGHAIYQLLQGYAGTVTTEVMAIAASAASLIFMAGSTRIVPENAALMIHPTSSYTRGDSRAHREKADLLDQINDSYILVYAQVSGRSTEELAPYMKQDTWLYGQDALELGFATHLGTQAGGEATASIAPGLTGAMRARMPEPVQELLAKVVLRQPPSAAAIPTSETERGSKGKVPGAAAISPVPVLADAADSQAQPTDSQTRQNSGAEQRSAPAGDPAVAAQQGQQQQSFDPDPVHTLPSTSEPSSVMSETPVMQPATNEELHSLCVAAGMQNTTEIDTLVETMTGCGFTTKAAALHLRDHVTSKNSRIVTRGAINSLGNTDEIGLTTEEIQSFRLVKLLAHLAEPDNRSVRDQAGFELDACRAAAERTKDRAVHGTRLPAEVVRAALEGQNTQTSRDGGVMIPTTTLMESLIELLFKKTAILNTNLTVLTDQVGDIEIPKEISGMRHYWVNEGQAPDLSAIAGSMIRFSPKTIGGKGIISRRMLKHSSIDSEKWVRNHLVKALRNGIDEDLMYANGTQNRPAGLFGIDGVHVHTLSGGVSKMINNEEHNFGTYADMVEMESKLGDSEIDTIDACFLMNTRARGALKLTYETENSDSRDRVYRNGMVNEYPVKLSNKLRNNDIAFGDFSHGVLVLYTGLDITVNASKYSDSGSIEVTALQDLDFNVTRPEAFCYAS
ncbi:MAG: phage major capsid protein [Aphanocapsa feldmannii 277cI]|uniref:Phage major capsid protein n=1 Tax=Aphanocapsa feldmannii 277cI TaxID=2507554 RepID=A0A524RVZ4_9CHRO|nr:MAG: phage major capsid protein [Aphanocapsa feldmannii 277cI]